MIYFDNAATSIVDPKVLDTYVKLVNTLIGNPAATNGKGLEANNYIEKARLQIASFFKLSNTQEIIFTSGATESNNIAIQGICEHYKNKGRHIITTSVEHPSVKGVFTRLAKEGFEVTYLNVNKFGEINLDELKSSLRKDTILVSIMGVNNEVGTIYPLKEISQIVHSLSSAIFMSDVTQAVGKTNIDYSLLDVATMSSHKIKGLKSIGLLIKSKGVILNPVFNGGSQEHGIRPGTENAPLICSLATAIRLYFSSFAVREKKARELNKYLRDELSKLSDEVQIVSSCDSLPFILNFVLLKHKASVIVEALSKKDIYVSTKSACSEHAHADSSVLEAMGYSEKQASNAIRLSFEGSEELEDGKKFISGLKEVFKTVKREE